MIQVKVGIWRGEVVQVSPEYEYCKRAAEDRKMELKCVYEEVLNLAKNILRKEGSLHDKVE